jgi:2-dehydro-3-deoxyphosphooctonate aldolase (KDO 8-P synthase)
MAVQIGPHSIVAGGPLFLVAGPCVLETEQTVLAIAAQVAAIAERLGVPAIFKASFDKANRTAAASARGPGLEAGLALLARVRAETGLPLLTDVHESWQVAPVAEMVDVLQIPAFLARQTDLLAAAGASGRAVNIKKGQFMAPEDMAHAAAKVGAADRTLLTERGTSFGYRDLVVDMRGLATLRATGCPLVFDATHSVQRPAADGNRSGGMREAIPALARAAAAAGIDGLFVETHPDPATAWSDSATAWPLDRLESLVADVQAIHRLVQERGMLGRG